MLKVENITKYYGNFLAVDNLSFEVKPGEIFGLLGVNGAGKTTTFRMIVGLLKPTSGNITLDGHEIDYNITDQIGFLTEYDALPDIGHACGHNLISMMSIGAAIAFNQLTDKKQLHLSFCFWIYVIYTSYTFFTQSFENS